MLTQFQSLGSCSLVSLVTLEASDMFYASEVVNTRHDENLIASCRMLNGAAKGPRSPFDRSVVSTEKPVLLGHTAEAVTKRIVITSGGSFHAPGR